MSKKDKRIKELEREVIALHRIIWQAKGILVHSVETSFTGKKLK